ncbi:MAG TPA: discoidin domain-containing protein, partial [Spirochaetes bacterium]|nr:discoidin domain-containing protein [Spirochaetota bacterium]
MRHFRISHPQAFSGEIVSYSSRLDDTVSAQRVLEPEGYWSSQKSTSLNHEFFIIDFSEERPFNYFEISPSPAGKTAFPTDFRVESSMDGTTWRVLHAEKKYELEDAAPYSVSVPLFAARFIKFLVTRPRKAGTKYFVEIGRFTCGIRGTVDTELSSHSSYEHNASRLLDDNDETFWESDLKPGTSRESLRMDLGDVFYINRLGLRASGIDPHGFPESFYAEASTDGSLWTPLFEEKGFFAEKSLLYTWEIAPTPARFVRFEMNTVHLENKQQGVRIAGVEVYGAPASVDHTHTIGDLTPQASVFQPGVVRLAKDGEDARGAVVQANDRRLRDASTIFKGIVQLAEDKDESPGMAVQSSDSRLKPASELKHGTVRLAYDRETSPGAAVQSNDSRLNEATEHSFGIVKLCGDGVYSSMSVVQGDDSRLRKADTTSYGICRLAENGEDGANVAVQGNDRRLKEATTVSKGIVELAEDGEDGANVAVQGNDRRLKEATTMSKGIVELA